MTETAMEGLKGLNAGGKGKKLGKEVSKESREEQHGLSRGATIGSQKSAKRFVWSMNPIHWTRMRRSRFLKAGFH